MQPYLAEGRLLASHDKSCQSWEESACLLKNEGHRAAGVTTGLARWLLSNQMKYEVHLFSIFLSQFNVFNSLLSCLLLCFSLLHAASLHKNLNAKKKKSLEYCQLIKICCYKYFIFSFMIWQRLNSYVLGINF